jgi:uncharacterized protein YjgD (DUF1641 family)
MTLAITVESPELANADPGALTQTLTALHQKLDQLTTQVQFLTAQAQIAERKREQRAELMHDLMPIANDAMRLATEQFQEVEHYVDPVDLLRLLKKLLRHGPHFERLFDQLGSMMELVEDATPLGKDAFGAAERTLDALDRKGYFTFAKGSAQIVDTIVTSFGEEDVKRLGENVVLMLNTVKDMTQPEILTLVRRLVANVESELEKPTDISWLALFGQMRDPNVRRGLAQTMRVLSAIGLQSVQK